MRAHMRIAEAFHQLFFETGMVAPYLEEIVDRYGQFIVSVGLVDSLDRSCKLSVLSVEFFMPEIKMTTVHAVPQRPVTERLYYISLTPLQSLIHSDIVSEI